MVLENNKKVEDLINDPTFDISQYHGYIYITIHPKTGRKYIGKKAFFHTTNVKLGKKELANLPVTRGKKPTKKQVIKESDWRTYYGSAVEIKKLPNEELERYVLKLCKDKKELTYWETKLLFVYNVLEDINFINDNILGKFYSKDLGDPRKD